MDAPGLLAALKAELATAPGWEGVMTHFHSADENPASVETQWRRFMAAVAALPRQPVLVHAANSAAALFGRTYAGDLVRPGIFLYGGNVGTPSPRPVVALQARVVALRTIRAGDTVGYGATWTASGETLIATLAAGYADGIPCSLGAGGAVELNGRIVPIAGRVSMDMTTVALPPGGARLGDVATVFGGLVSLDAQARRAGTISYELLAGLGGRLPRRYLSR